MHPMIRLMSLTAFLSGAGVAAAPTAPSDSTTTPVLAAVPSSSKVALKWSLCPTCDSYEVFRSTASSGPWVSIAKVKGSVAHLDTGLVSRNLYFYRVSGFRGTVEGDFSDVLQVITLDSLADTLSGKQKPTHP